MRLMPERIQLGVHSQSTMMLPMGQRREFGVSADPLGRRTVMGYVIPEWQRPLVWTRSQSVSFMESAWLGVDVGTFTYNQVSGSVKFDSLLIDGQQRMNAIQEYLNGEFPVFGHTWQELPEVDKRAFKQTHFCSYMTRSTNDPYLRSYYDTMNFSGTRHSEDQRAS